VIEGAEVEMGVQARTVAVIDDDLPVLESLVNLLASSGYKAEPYSSAEQSLGRMVFRGHPALLPM
jgi:FixJ family two-component response regulator